MKKLLVLTMAAALSLTLAACGEPVDIAPLTVEHDKMGETIDVIYDLLEADPNETQEQIDGYNQIVDGYDEFLAIIEAPDDLTEEDVASLLAELKESNAILEELQGTLEAAASAGDDVEADTETEDGEVEDVSAMFAGTVWTDEDDNIFGFDSDGITMYLVLNDGTEVDGQYALATDNEEVVVLVMDFPTIETSFEYVLTAYSDTSLEFTDMADDMPIVLTPAA